ncbi:hypothetical protein INR49_026332 [Caranx melampygus]|nr:hypothetical protein INR49_026332 [Caranx melampygus]
MTDHTLQRGSAANRFRKLLLLVGGGVTGHCVEVHQISQHTVTQHRQVGGDGCQSVAHEDTRGVTG